LCPCFHLSYGLDMLTILASINARKIHYLLSSKIILYSIEK
jgi:hypothetical protein